MIGKSNKKQLLSAFSCSAYWLKISTLPPDFAKSYQVFLFFQPIRFVPQTGFHIQHRSTKYFSNLSKVLHIFSALLFVFQNIFLVNIVHWLSKFPLSYFFGSFALVLR